MASLINLYTNEKVLMNVYHQFGRALLNDTLMEFPDISRKHATIFWDETGWKILDHSKNGTIIDQKPLHQGSMDLRRGNIIQFGSNKSSSWKVLDAKAPCSYLKSASQRNQFIELNSNLMLWPHEGDPDVSFYKATDTLWRADLGSEIVDLKNKMHLNFCSDEWIYVENQILTRTSDLNDISKHACFIFNISPNEEEVSVKIEINSLHINLGERVYHHVLLKLVMQKYLDAQKGYDPEKQGWLMLEQITDYLRKELLMDVDEYYLNVQIHRLRKRLAELSPYGCIFASIIERKNGEIRFNHPFFKIFKDRKLMAECTSSPNILLFEYHNQ